MKQNKAIIKDRGTTIFLKTALLSAATGIVLLSAWAISDVSKHWVEDSPDLAFWEYPLLVVIAASALTFCAAVRQIWKLLNLVDRNMAFTNASVNTMKYVKYCGFILSALFTTLMPIVFHAADTEDAPGMILIYGAIFIGIPFVIAVFSGVAQRLFQNAIDIKKENDLTV